jgi:ketosteroid isomerase-like protein
MAERAAISDTVRQLFTDLAEATSALDLDSLLALYDHGEDFKFAAYGSVVTPYSAFADTVYAHFNPLVQVSFVPDTILVDVLSRDVAIATAPFRFSGTPAQGESLTLCGVYTAVYSRTPQPWRIIYAGESSRATCD